MYKNLTWKNNLVLPTTYQPILKNQCLLNAPNVFFICLSLPSINRNTCFSNGSCCMVLGTENVAARPLHLKGEKNFKNYLCAHK